jgi:transcriptional regulator GlxA family with amidase domain
MKHISILIPLGHSSLPNIDGTHQILSEVNKFAEMMGQPPVFKIQLVGLEKETIQRNGLYKVSPDCLISDVKKTDLIIVPAMHGNQREAIERNKTFIPWIIDQYKAGAELASYCIGSFFLAATTIGK